MKILTDTHTHTLASGHAYSTIEENFKAASLKGLELVGITDHFSPLFISQDSLSGFGAFINKKALPESLYGVKLLFGAEVDIIDLDGNLFGHDIYFPFKENETYLDSVLDKLDYLIASIHERNIVKASTSNENTKMYLKALEHRNVKILGHIGRMSFPFDVKEVVLYAKSLNKMIEINESTLSYDNTAKNRCREIAICCAENGTQVVVNSDAHFSSHIGIYTNSIKMLEEINFPTNLIANIDAATFLGAISLP